MNDDLESDYIKLFHHISTFVIDDCLCPATVDGVPIRKLFVSNLAERTTFKDLRNCFSAYGNIENCYLCRNEGKKNYAFVTFSNVKDAIRALKDGGNKKIRLHNRDLRVMAADSWNQPDSIKQLFHVDKKWNKEKKTATDQYTQGLLQNDNESVSIHMLNDDCLIHIFQFLPIFDKIRIERVCKRWRVLSQESWHTMRTLDLLPSTWGHPLHVCVHTVSLRKVLLKCGRFLTQIDLSETPNYLSQSTLTIVGKFCPNLININVSGLTACAPGIQTIASNCRNLTRLTLGPSIYSLDNDLKNIFKTHKNLEYFAIHRNEFLGKCLSYLPVQAMRTLILFKCYNVQDNDVSTALKRLENLEHLVIDGCTSIAEYTLEAISKYCKNLRVLELHGFFPFIRTMDMLYFNHLVNLQIFKVTNTGALLDDQIINMVLNCRELICIDITGCYNVTNIGVAAIAALSKLEKLIINFVCRITVLYLDNTQNLKELECRACLLSDDVISRIIVSSPRLQLLDLSGCHYITNTTLEVAKRTCNTRTSNVMLKLIIGGTKIFLTKIDEEVSPFLQTIKVNLCEVPASSFIPIENIISDSVIQNVLLFN